MTAGSDERNIFVAISMRNVHRLRSLLSTAGDLNVRDRSFRTPLIHAVVTCSDESLTHVVRLLLRHGCDVNAQDDVGRTALMHACRERDKLGVVKLLASCRQSDFNLQDIDGNTALIHAADSGNISALRILTSHVRMASAPKMDLKNAAGLTALELAAKLGHAECCRVLMESGADCARIKNTEIWIQLTESRTKNPFQTSESQLDSFGALDDSSISMPKSSRGYTTNSSHTRPGSKLTFRERSQVSDTFRREPELLTGRKTNRSAVGLRKDLPLQMRSSSHAGLPQHQNWKADALLLEKTGQQNSAQRMPSAWTSSGSRTVAASTENGKTLTSRNRKTKATRPLTPISNSASPAGDIPLPFRLPSIPSGKKLCAMQTACSSPTDTT